MSGKKTTKSDEPKSSKEHYKAMFGTSQPTLSSEDWSKHLDWDSFKRQYYENEGEFRTTYDNLKVDLESAEQSNFSCEFDDPETKNFKSTINFNLN